MKNMIPILSMFFLFTGCNNEKQTEPQETSIYGTWQMIEQSLGNVGNILKKITTEIGVTVLLVEQFVSFALSFSNSYYFLQGGEVTRHGRITPENRNDIIDSIKL